MENKKTYYHLVLDRSASMYSCWKQTRQAFEQQFKVMRQMNRDFTDQEIYFSYCLFNDQLLYSREIRPIGEACFEISTVETGGMTALHDAIGNSVAYIKNQAGHALQEEGSTVVMLILTDGHENASSRYSGADIKSLMRSLKAEEKWTFLFLGADIDIENVTQDLNVDKDYMTNVQKGDMDKTVEMISEEMNNYFQNKADNTIKSKFFVKK